MPMREPRRRRAARTRLREPSLPASPMGAARGRLALLAALVDACRDATVVTCSVGDDGYRVAAAQRLQLAEAHAARTRLAALHGLRALAVHEHDDLRELALRRRVRPQRQLAPV